MQKLMLAAWLLLAAAPCSGAVADGLSDFEVVYRTLYAECRGEVAEGQRAVASVIWNRAARGGKTVRAVCLARRQFSCWNAGAVQVAGSEIPALRRLAAEIVDGGFRAAGPWTHYYNPAKCRPAWAAGLTEAALIGRHRFGVLRCP